MQERASCRAATSSVLDGYGHGEKHMEGGDKYTESGYSFRILRRSLSYADMKSTMYLQQPMPAPLHNLYYMV